LIFATGFNPAERFVSGYGFSNIKDAGTDAASAAVSQAALIAARKSPFPSLPLVHVPQFLEASFVAVENLRSTSQMGALIEFI
jgi:hypothetical protein